MSRVAKKAAKTMALRCSLNRKGNSIEDRKRLKELRDTYYSTDEYHPSPGAAWNPDGNNAARGSTGRTKKLLSGWQAKQKQGLNIKR